MPKLTREQLYKWVWSSPVAKIADELGVSGSGLGRKCRAYDIPTPGRGYWQQVARGVPVQYFPLPSPDKRSDQVAIDVSQERVAKLDQLSMPHAESTDKESTALDLTEVPSSLNSKNVSTLVGETADTGAFRNGPFVPGFSESGPKLNMAPSDIVRIADLFCQSEIAVRLVEGLRARGQECDAPTRAVLTLWIETAKAFIPNHDPIGLIIRECQKIASGEEDSEWWASIQQR